MCRHGALHTKPRYQKQPTIIVFTATVPVNVYARYGPPRLERLRTVAAWYPLPLRGSEASKWM